MKRGVDYIGVSVGALILKSKNLNFGVVKRKKIWFTNNG